jgi:Uma2 family endonuclease
VYVAKGNEAGLLEDGFYGSPDLLVEVVSSRPSLDRVIKFRKYMSASVAHYWIVDPKARVVEPHELVQGAYAARARHRDDEIFEPALFPGLRIELARLWS